MEARSNGGFSSRHSDHASRIHADLSMSLDGGVKKRHSKMQAIKRSLPLGRQVHVCIVGAGAAGLRAADMLLRGGAKVTIMEARDRIGGRVAQTKLNGHVIDLGPNWIHGTDRNPIMDIALATETGIQSWEGKQAVVDVDGAFVNEAPLEEASNAFWGIIADAFKHSNNSTKVIPASKSLYEFVHERADEICGSCDSPAKSMLLHEAEVWGVFIGSPIQRQSLKYFWLEECLEGENPYVSGTYGKILDHIAARALAHADIRLGCRVTRITSSHTDEDITVETENDPSEEFDEVIVTTPLGWLKRNHKTFFEPPLPDHLAKAIDTLCYGNLDKCYITFPTAWWDTPPEPESNSQPSSPSTPHHYPEFTHWQCPRYAASTNPHGWNLHLINMAASQPATTAHPTLLFYYHSDCALHIASQAAALSPSAFQAFLTSFFAPYYSRLPNYDVEAAHCTPAAALATNWAGDELAGYGSYSNFQVGMEDGDAHIEALREGLPERRVWFAGEHVAPFVALGTVTGAYWAGEGVAGRILRAYRMGCAEEGEKFNGRIDGK